METRDEYLRRAHLVKDTMREQLNQRSMKYQYHDAEVTLLEGLMARGDRKIADVIVSAYKNGAMYDSWSDQFSMEYWDKAYEETGIDPDFYTLRERSIDEVFPWDFIDSGVTKNFLIR